MRSKGATSKSSKVIIATQLSTGLVIKVKGMRAFCTLLWGNNPSGVPRYISSVIEMCQGKSKQESIKGWTFRYAPPTPRAPMPVIRDIIGSYLKKQFFIK